MSEQVQSPGQREGEQVGGADEPQEGQGRQPEAEEPAADQPGEAAGAGSMPQTAADLAAMLEGRSDEEIVAGIRAQGYDHVLGQVFAQMQARFLPDRAAGRTAVIQYDITTPEGTESYQVDVDNGTCTTSRGTTREPVVTLVLGLPDFFRLISGKLNGVQAFMSGKLRIRGDMMMAQTMQGWFDQG
jgi:putative sterol carrier protein